MGFYRMLSEVRHYSEHIAFASIFLVAVISGIFLVDEGEEARDNLTVKNLDITDKIGKISPSQIEEIRFSEKDVEFEKLKNYDKDFDQKMYGFDAGKNTTLRLKGPFIIKKSSYFIAEDHDSNATRIFLLQSENYTDIQNSSIEKEVMGLKNLYIKTRTDPLFYSSYAENLSFAKYHDLRKKVFGPLYPHIEIVRERNLYPQRFWGNLTTTIERTNNFYDTTSKQNAIEMLDQYENTAKAYDKGLVNFVHYLNESGFEESVIGFSNGGETTPSLLSTNIQRMSNNSQRLLDETKTRRGILHGNKSLERYFPKQEVNYTEVSFGRATLSDSEIKKSFHEQENFSSSFLNEAEVEGPYKVEMACSGNTRQMVRLEHEDADDYYPLYHIADGYFRSTEYVMKENFTYRGERRIIYNGTEQIGYLAERDIAMLNCNCPYNNNVAVEWQVIDAVVEKLKEKPIYGGLKTDKIEDKELKESVERGKRIEKNLMLTPSTEEVEALARNLQQTRQIVFQQTEKEYNVRIELLERMDYMWKIRVLIDSKLPMMTHPLNNYYDSSDEFRRGLYRGEITGENVFPPPTAMLLDYSYYSLTFGSFSDTVWRAEEEPEYWEPLLINNFPDRYLEELNNSTNH